MRFINVCLLLLLLLFIIFWSDQNMFASSSFNLEWLERFPYSALHETPNNKMLFSSARTVTSCKNSSHGRNFTLRKVGIMR